MTRIVILGCAGSGKTRLARAIAGRIDAPVVHLDALWRPFARSDDVAAFRECVRSAHAGSSWISDGNFADVTFDLRLPLADTIVWLDRPRVVCAARSVTRLFRRGAPHSIAELRVVLSFIGSYERVSRPQMERLRTAIAPRVPVVPLRTDREVALFLDSFASARMAIAQPGAEPALPLSPAA